MLFNSWGYLLERNIGVLVIVIAYPEERPVIMNATLVSGHEILEVIPSCASKQCRLTAIAFLAAGKILANSIIYIG